jgi:hypothetical protein
MNKLALGVVCFLLLGMTLGSIWFFNQPDRKIDSPSPDIIAVVRNSQTNALSSKTESIATNSFSRGVESTNEAPSAIARTSPASHWAPAQASRGYDKQFGVSEKSGVSKGPNDASATGLADLRTSVPGEGLNLATSLGLPEFGGGELSVLLSPGVREPAVIFDPQEGLSDQQAEALADLSDEFIRKVEGAAGTAPEEELTETWDRAQEDADSQYRNIFGEAAYHQMLMEAAIADLKRAGVLQ